MPEIKRTKPANSADTFRFSEVQSALNEQLMGNQSAWMTDGFLEQLMRHPALNKLFSSNDPEISDAIAMFSSNPAEAMEYYKEKPVYLDALKAFAGMLGSHFERMGEEQDRRREELGLSKDQPAYTGPKIVELTEDDEDVVVKPAIRVKQKPVVMANEDAIRPALTIPSDLPDHEKELIRRVMSDPELQVCFCECRRC
jgi:arsenate reductase-like glutaredoxin family protein